MRKLFNKKNARPNKRSHGHRHDYNELEDRRVLAVLTALDAMTGQLTIDITGPNETASIAIDSGLVVVNGNNDLDSAMGNQTLNFEALRSIVIDGEEMMIGQSVELLGDYSAANGANIQTISISNVNSILIYGNYVLAGDFVANLDGDGGGVSELPGVGDGTFAAQATYPAGNTPFSVTAGDFNGDGVTDLATANADSNNVSVLLGVGDGTFAAQATYAVGNGPRSVTTGDFNGDGVTDLATANVYSDNVSVLLGLSDGTFMAQATYAAGDAPGSITTGDFNGDGVTDLATANVNPDNVSVLLGVSDGTFEAQATYPTGNYPVSVTTGDFDGDGVTDLATANRYDSVSVLLGEGDGTFAAQATYAAGNFPRSITTGDFNGDGLTDLATANTSSDNVSVLLGEGDGTFAAQAIFAAGDAPRSITTGDFNGDGVTDLATANVASDNVSVLLGVSDGTFEAQATYAGDDPWSVTTGDFNGDGITDLATANAGSDNISVLLGANDGSLGRLVVGGTTNIDAGNNPIVLNNELNDFVGAVSLATGDAGVSAWIYDANDIEFSELTIAGNIHATAGGDITDTNDSIINIEGLGGFSGANIALGNNTAGTTEIFRVTLNTTGHAELYLDNAVMFFGMNSMGSLEVDTDQGIFDGRKTAINIAGLATLRGGEGIQLGDLLYDIFNAGSLNLNSDRLIEITENSSIQIAGDNTARSMNLHSFGDITDADEASINVDFVTRFNADNVYIGDTADDEFNAGSIQFDADGDMFLNENTGTHIVESNQANRFELVSDGPISDAVNASIDVATLSSFKGGSVMIGDTDTDSFRSGWITFKTVHACFISENDSTIIANLNTAETATIVSMGSIINANLARIFVTGDASFSGTGITLGNMTDDNLRFGGLALNAIGSATVFEDDASMFVGSTSAGELRMNSVGNITDATGASINVSGAAIFYSETAGIRLGDSATDEFNAGSLTLDAVNGIANVTENSDIFLTGVNQSRSLVLDAQGSINDDAFASIDLDFLLSVTGTEVDLGDAATDVLRFGSLTFNTSGNISVASQETIVLTGTSEVVGELALTSEVNIFDSLNAQTTADSAVLTAINIVLGDTDFDCFDVLPANTVIAASGTVNITYGC